MCNESIELFFCFGNIILKNLIMRFHTSNRTASAGSTSEETDNLHTKLTENLTMFLSTITSMLFT